MQNLNEKPYNLQDRAYRFSLEILRFSSKLSTNPRFKSLVDQLFRCGTSVGANITEAKAASSRLEFKKFQEIALKSANETVFWLNLVLDSGEFKEFDPQTNQLIDECSQLARMLASGIIKLKANKL